MYKNFNKLNVDEQVSYINNQLKKSDISLNKLLKRMRVNKAKIITDLKSNGYEYIKKDRCYIKVKNEVIQNDSTNKKFEFDDKDIKNLKELAGLKNDLKKIIHSYNINRPINNKNASNELKINMNEYSGELKKRLVKVYSNVNEDWMKFCEKNKQFKMQDLYSKALKEFIEKYN